MSSHVFLTAPDLRPDDGRILWTRASDGVNLRLALWPRKDARGTVLWFSGRTEYIEKYGPAARAMAERGFASATLDWRGQGLSDRLLRDPSLGHVDAFLDYQKDVEAFLRTVHEAKMPKPWFLVGHSMGGAIGLRSLLLGLDAKAAVFSAPMWGIQMRPALRPLLIGFGRFMEFIGRSKRRAPGTDSENYVATAPFEDNVLTGDEEMFRFMFETLVVNPQLGLAGPTVHWVNEALRETNALTSASLPDTPTLITLGTEESVVSPQAIHAQAARWPSADLRIFEGAHHEVMMETPDLREAFYDDCAAQFSG